MSEAIDILLKEATMRDIDTARGIISKSVYTVVVVKNGNVIYTCKDNQLESIVSAITTLEKDIRGSVIGCSMVGKAAAFLCRFSKPNGVYSMRGTKTGIALLIMGGIPCQIDEMVPNVESAMDTEMCPFEDVIDGSESSEEVYSFIIKELERQIY